MAKANGKRKGPGRPPAPRYNLERNPSGAIGRLVGDAMDSMDTIEESLRRELDTNTLTQAERLLVASKLVDLSKTRSSMIGEVVSAFGRKRAEGLVEQLQSPGSVTPGSPFSPGEQILPTVKSREPQQTEPQEPL